MDRAKQPPPHEPRPDERVERTEEDARRAATDAGHDEPNPPHTTRGGITAPKFGAAGSGGAELEPGPPRP